MGMNPLFGPGMDAVETSMRFRQARQSLLSANVANADTPGYRRVELRFEQELDASSLRLAATSPGHIGAQPGRVGEQHLERGPHGSRPDRNGVDLDHELIELSRNAGAFQQQAEVLSRLLALRRIAATGEPR